jgi:hypothetical protein
VGTNGGVFGRLFTTFIPGQEAPAMQRGGYLSHRLRRDAGSGAFRRLGSYYIQSGKGKYHSHPRGASATHPFRLAPPFSAKQGLNFRLLIFFCEIEEIVILNNS